MEEAVYNNNVDMVIWARNYQMDIIDLVEQWTEFHVDLKWCDQSTWQLKLPTTAFFDAFHLGGQYGPASTLIKNGIACFRNQEVLPFIAGPITSATRDWNGADDFTTLNGMSDNYWLTGRAGIPLYNANPPSTGDWIAGYPEYSGYLNTPAESVMKNFLYYWIGPGQPTAWRQLPFFTTTGTHTPQLGANLNYWLRWESMYDMCKKACQQSQADLSFQIIDTGYSPPFNLWFQVYPIVDVTSSALFGTDLGTVRSFSFTENRPQANVVYGAGPDFDPSTLKISQEIGYRLYWAKTDGGSVIKYGDTAGNAPQAGRIEEFFDCGSITTQTPTKAQIIAAMSGATDAELKKQAYSATVEINLEPNDMADFGQVETGSGDFRLGCKVSVQLEDLVLADVIREIKADFTPDKGEVITPIVCDPMKFYNRSPMPFTYQNRWQMGDMLHNWK